MRKDKIFLPWEIIPKSALRPVFFPKVSFKKAFGDPSILFLLLSNLLTIIVAFSRNWEVLTVVWVYLIQAIIIGLFKVIRVLTIKKLLLKDLYIHGYTGWANKNLRISLALYVAFYLGIFSLVCFFLLLTSLNSNGSLTLPEDKKFVFITSFVFLVNHLFSFLYFRQEEKEAQKVSEVISAYFWRLQPLYLMIIIGIYFGRYSLTVFLLTKTIIDVAFHIGEHAVLEANLTDTFQVE